MTNGELRLVFAEARARRTPLMVERFEPHPNQPTEPRQLTQDEVALASWLIAERDWHREVAEWQRNEERIKERQRRDEEYKVKAEAKFQAIMAAHEECARSASAFRRAVRAALKEIAASGCLCCGESKQFPICTVSSPSTRSEWCEPCIARETLDEVTP